MRLLQRDSKSLAAHASISLKARQRCDRMLPRDVLAWADNAGSEISRALYQYETNGTPEDLAEVKRGVLMLLGCVESLEQRVRPGT